jgi:hypothetical protein
MGLDNWTTKTAFKDLRLFPLFGDKMNATTLYSVRGNLVKLVSCQRFTVGGYPRKLSEGVAV